MDSFGGSADQKKMVHRSDAAQTRLSPLLQAATNLSSDSTSTATERGKQRDGTAALAFMKRIRENARIERRTTMHATYE